jgi:poly(hydroxyalkanoate) granule-associated protein
MSEKNETGRNAGWMDELERYSRQVRLAGLGAYSRFSKDGSKLFESLIQDGEEAERARQQGRHSEARGDEAAHRGARDRFEQARERAAGKWNELEEVFDRRLGSTLDRLGVPTRAEIQILNERIDALKARLDKLEGVPVAEEPHIFDPSAPDKPTGEAETIILPDGQKPL